MNASATVWRVVALTVFISIFSAANAEVVSVPAKLSGKWTTVDGLYGQSISANIDAATARGKLTVWSSDSSCTIRDAPITVTAAEGKIFLKVDSAYSNPCRADISVELARKAGSDEYEGELRQGGPAGAKFPILRVKMSP